MSNIYISLFHYFYCDCDTLFYQALSGSVHYSVTYGNSNSSSSSSSNNNNNKLIMCFYCKPSREKSLDTLNSLLYIPLFATNATRKEKIKKEKL